MNGKWTASKQKQDRLKVILDCRPETYDELRNQAATYCLVADRHWASDPVTTLAGLRYR